MHSSRIAQRRVFQQLAASRLQSFRQLYQSTTPTFRTRSPVQPRTPTSFYSRAIRPTTNPFSRAFRSQGRYQSTTSTSASASSANLSLSQRLKKLSREYGWSALGIYLFLSALDFPFCFLAVRLLGTDRIGHWEHLIISTVKEWVTWPLLGSGNHATQEIGQEAEATVNQGEALLKKPLDDVRAETGSKRILEEDQTYVLDHGVREAEEANKGENASIWTQLALAYAIHKSFIFLRVPATVAITPKVVKTFRGWGWNIGKMPMKGKMEGVGGKVRVNTKGAGVKP